MSPKIDKVYFRNVVYLENKIKCLKILEDLLGNVLRSGSISVMKTNTKIRVGSRDR